VLFSILNAAQLTLCGLSAVRNDCSIVMWLSNACAMRNTKISMQCGWRSNLFSAQKHPLSAAQYAASLLKLMTLEMSK